MNYFVDVPVGLDVWQGPSLRSESVGFLAPGSRVTASTTRRRGWVRLTGRVTGWVPSDLLSARKPDLEEATR